MHKLFLNKFGFSLLEVMIVVAIFVIILSSVATLTSDKTVREDLTAQSQAVVDIFSRAHNYAMTAYYGDHWGVKILNNHADCDEANSDCVIIFKGKTYDHRNAVYDEKLVLNTSVFIDEEQANEFYFEKISGWLATTTGALVPQTLFLQTNLGTTQSILVSQTGLIYAGSNGYDYRRSISIDNTKVSGASDLVDFPVLIAESASYLKATEHGGDVKNDLGYDIIFSTDSSGNNILAHEIEKYASTTGELVAWVKIPNLATSENTTIYMFYGNDNVGSSMEQIDTVWNANYMSVQHMSQSPIGASPQIIDSTSNNHDGTASGSFDAGDLLTGKIGQAIDFNGTDTKFDFVSNNPIGTAENGFTLSAWVKRHSTASGQHAVSFSYIQLRPGICYVWDTAWRSVSYSGYLPALETWYYLSCTFDGSNLRGYVNNSATSPIVVTGNILDATNFTVGYQSTEFANSVLDEIRISNVARSSDWILTEYNNQYSTSTFYSVSSATVL